MAPPGRIWALFVEKLRQLLPVFENFYQALGLDVIDYVLLAYMTFIEVFLQLMGITLVIFWWFFGVVPALGAKVCHVILTGDSQKRRPE